MFECKSASLLGLALSATLAGSAWADVLNYQGKVTQGTATFNVFLSLNRPQPTQFPGQAFASGRIETNVPGTFYLLQSGSLKNDSSVVAKIYVSESGANAPATPFAGQLSGVPGTPTSQILASFSLRFADQDYVGVPVTLTPVGSVPPVQTEPVAIGGVGVYIRLDPTNQNALTVDSPIPDTPALKAGIQAGDVILQIDDTSTKNITIPQAQALLKGKIGTPVRLLIKHPHQLHFQQNQWYNLVRAHVEGI